MPVCNDSSEEYEEARLRDVFAACGETGCEVVKRACLLAALCDGWPLNSSDIEMGDDRAGDDSSGSSKSVARASTEAAKLLEISVSDTMAKDDCVDVVDAVDVVRSRVENLDVRGSSCHVEFATSRLPYKRPCKSYHAACSLLTLDGKSTDSP